jgi:apolipoprotein D and lipocalin family protein
VFGRIGICSTAGTATIPDPAQPAKLKVKLDSGFGRVADYWVVEVGPEENGKYSWSIVTNAQQSSLFILFRTRTPDGALYSAVIEKVKGYGFDLSKIKKTPQTNCDDASSL